MIYMPARRSREREREREIASISTAPKKSRREMRAARLYGARLPISATPASVCVCAIVRGGRSAGAAAPEISTFAGFHEHIPIYV
uniref:Uncharacterized protein n=1 Tax=Trichogramma kaykai TaxID=54128 RepID=A0ABD2XNP6_9HYME